jgi:uncharacterized protein (DUF433 family)
MISICRWQHCREQAIDQPIGKGYSALTTGSSTNSHSNGEGDNTPCIVCTPDVLGGKPRIAGRRIAVQQVVIWHEQGGMSRAQIASEFDFTPEEVDAALTYYRNHRDEIDAALRADDEYVARMQQEALFSREPRA